MEAGNIGKKLSIVYIKTAPSHSEHRVNHMIEPVECNSEPISHLILTGKMI